MIYLLEDDTSIQNFVLYTLKNTGFEAEGFERPSDFWKALEKQMPDLLLLDIMLPEEDGMEILRKLRAEKKTKYLPIIMLTAKGTEYDKVLGLDSGADDFIAKPFGMMEFVARVKAVLRRRTPKKVTKELTAGNVRVQIDQHIVWAGEEKIELTLKEFEMLRYLLENKGIVLTRDQLLEHIWGYDFDGETRTVDVHVRTLRQKLGDGGSIIETVRGVGYRIGGNK